MSDSKRWTTGSLYRLWAVENHMDKLTRHNQARWEALAKANVAYSRPFLDLTPESAWKVVDEQKVLRKLGWDIAGKNVLCLAGGGGQQSVAFGLLEANVTVLDFSATQLERDADALQHYGLSARLEQGDMRDLSRFPDDSFDLVFHAFSINFVPDPDPVFADVRRVLQPGGIYRMQCHNPFVMGMDETGWTGEGYLLKSPYRAGAVEFDELNWTFEGEDGTKKEVEGPVEFRHTMNRLIAGIAGNQMVILGMWEELPQESEPEPGSWEHFKSIAPPWLTIWASYQPDLFQQVWGQ